MNSIENKCEILKKITGNKTDILLIPETKLENTFLLNQLF